MLYPFQSKSGRVVDLEYPMVDAPPIGKRRKIDGEWFTRVACAPELNPYIGRPGDGRFKSISAPSESNAKLWGIKPPKHGYDKDGSALFMNKGEAREHAKACSREDGDVAFDG